MTDEKLDKIISVRRNMSKLRNEIQQLNKTLINGIRYPTNINTFDGTMVDVPESIRKMILQEILYKKEWQLKQLKKYFEEA